MRPTFCVCGNLEHLYIMRDGPDLIVIRSVSSQNTAQVRFAEHDEVFERLAGYRFDEPLNVAVLARRVWCGRVVSDPHCTNAASVRWTECAVAVANQVTRRFVPGKGISHMTGDPLSGRIVRHADTHQSPSCVAKNSPAIEHLLIRRMRSWSLAVDLGGGHHVGGISSANRPESRADATG